MSLDFSRENRLLIPRQFKAVFDSPSGKIPGKNVLLLARDNGLDHPRLGLVIGKKSVKLSVERNRLKRLIRESFRKHQALLAGWDIVIVARKGIADSDNVEITRQFDKFWKRLQRTQKAETQPVIDSGVAPSQDA
ncbi:ribonuclease P protein component [Pseudomonas sp. N040]|uniref:ribonuclease P protein component n=1 Tax=Pseudomonas sp. N040 TaxID=2785325 RepID=UPI0018A27297|nr:ribonuclease P protein component [Pseudomonas sp. N040]MBF7728875.1 ribonuclease P protein component [Pseudomonas sp. N040]MBW7012515.1 ribonuclease P protein component [Pseudomonas sp. N040]